MRREVIAVRVPITIKGLSTYKIYIADRKRMELVMFIVKCAIVSSLYIGQAYTFDAARVKLDRSHLYKRCVVRIVLLGKVGAFEDLASVSVLVKLSSEIQYGTYILAVNTTCHILPQQEGVSQGRKVQGCELTK